MNLSIRSKDLLNEFKDKVVIVTGATSGVGRQASILFAKSGMQVVAAGRIHIDSENVIRCNVATQDVVAGKVKHDPIAIVRGVVTADSSISCVIVVNTIIPVSYIQISYSHIYQRCLVVNINPVSPGRIFAADRVFSAVKNDIA